jgi:hypothetical protein
MDGHPENAVEAGLYAFRDSANVSSVHPSMNCQDVHEKHATMSNDVFAFGLTLAFASRALRPMAGPAGLQRIKMQVPWLLAQMAL